MGIVRHPLHPALRVPDAFVEACAYFEKHPDDDGVFGCDLDASILRGAADDDSSLPYENLPLELVPFAWTGDAGRHYSWAVLAPELDLADQICVAIAPNDEGPFWLGDTTKQGLENLLVRTVRGWERRDKKHGAPSPTDDASWPNVIRALGLAPDLTADVLNHRIAPTVPPGYRWMAVEDNVGVLAPTATFAPDDVVVPRDGYDEALIAEAKKSLDAGHPATALWLLKHYYQEVSIVTAMRDAYAALGRALHVERADRWLAIHEGE